MGYDLGADKDLQRRRAFHEAGHVVCALAYGIPILAASIADNHSHMLRGRYRPPLASIGLEAMTVLCMSGAAAEEFFCGPITDGGDCVDLEMARDYLTRAGFDPLRVGAGLKQARDAAQRLVRTPAVEDRIRLIADALLRHGTLSGDDIGALVGLDSVGRSFY
jgi:hypothetical protein